MKRIVEQEYAHNIKTARRLVERSGDMVWDILEEVIQDHPVLLNRAPTLHRLGIQAFEPVLVEGRAIKLHPLVCTAYNADFDGDQMAVHVPLSAEAQAEARFLMLSANNLLKPQDGQPVTVPTQDMVMGCYYLTIDMPDEKGEGKFFSSLEEAVMAYDFGDIGLHAPISIRTDVKTEGGVKTGMIQSTLGRFLFNEIIPQDLGFVDRSNPDNTFVLEFDQLIGKNDLQRIIDKCIHTRGISETAEILDRIKRLGFHYSTKGGISIGIFDMIVPDVKKQYVAEAEQKVELINRRFQQGLLDDTGRYEAVVETWRVTTDEITEELKKNLGRYNPVNMMSQSGARGNINQIKQLAGIRGSMTDTSGKTIEIPIKSNLREGMNVLEFFINSHGARKALSDTALKTADSGYLTRRLVDVSQDVIVREDDCGTDEYVEAVQLTVGGRTKRTLKSLADRVLGRNAAADVVHPETGDVIVKKNHLITDTIARAIEAAGVTRVKIRSVLVCKSHSGVCAKCYGMNLATGGEAVGGEAVGIMAAQSIGEPGTQLTMRTFHTGGIASGDDITQGLPRVEELFEARKPKGQAIMAELSGVVHMEEESQSSKRKLTITGAEGEAKEYDIPYGASLLVDTGDEIEAGDRLTDGSANPHDIMKIKGVTGVQRYIIDEVLKVYNNNGVDINDKHIEIIARQMMRKIKVDDPGDTELLTGSTVDYFDFLIANEEAEKAGQQPSTGKRVLLGITKASLATDSFLSAASFQETTRVLTDAAVKGKIDPLLGLKENVIIGKLIPAGTGIAQYRTNEAVPNVEQNQEMIRKNA